MIVTIFKFVRFLNSLNSITLAHTIWNSNCFVILLDCESLSISLIGICYAFVTFIFRSVFHLKFNLQIVTNHLWIDLTERATDWWVERIAPLGVAMAPKMFPVTPVIFSIFNCASLILSLTLFPLSLLLNSIHFLLTSPVISLTTLVCF